MTQQQAQATRFTCPACGKFLGVSDGRYFEPPPCSCGWATTVVNKKRAS